MPRALLSSWTLSGKLSVLIADTFSVSGRTPSLLITWPKKCNSVFSACISLCVTSGLLTLGTPLLSAGAHCAHSCPYQRQWCHPYRLQLPAALRESLPFSFEKFLGRWWSQKGDVWSSTFHKVLWRWLASGYPCPEGFARILKLHPGKRKLWTHSAGLPSLLM